MYDTSQQLLSRDIKIWVFFLLSTQGVGKKANKRNVIVMARW